MIPVLIVLALYAKNERLFGFWGASSWYGLSLAKMTMARLDPAERAAMIHDGRLSPFAAAYPFSRLERYEAAAGIRFDDPDIPAIGDRLRSGDRPNYNHLAYVLISLASMKDARAVIAASPTAYLGAVWEAMGWFFTPMTYFPPFEGTRTILGAWSRLHEATIEYPPVSAILFFLAGLAGIAGVRRGLTRG